MKLLIAIPALNEEESSARIKDRFLDASAAIVSSSPVSAVEITVVSDGSSDRTVDIARRYADRIRLVVFPENRGYGAAIKAAWESSDADLLGFIDADGTCDPEAFTSLCRALVAEDADIVVGSRLGPRNEMPLVRRIGNLLFAVMLTAASSRRVQDVASGMRVVRRTCLPRLFPLPDRLQFTPAMSARALLSRDLRICEVPIPYHERVGRSKLRVVRDGLRFLRVVAEATLLYRPSRPLALLGIACGLVASGLMVMPTLYYLHNRSVAEWMIYRFVVSGLMASSACLLLTSAHLTRKIVSIVLTDGTTEERHPARGPALAAALFWILPISMFMVGGALVMPSFLELVRTGGTYEHWSRFIAMSALFSCALILVVAKIFDYCMDLLAARVAYLRATGVSMGAVGGTAREEPARDARQ
jgi:glycosyltransferase involved in cell wall biosynthesis